VAALQKCCLALSGDFVSRRPSGRDCEPANKRFPPFPTASATQPLDKVFDTPSTEMLTTEFAVVTTESPPVTAVFAPVTGGFFPMRGVFAAVTGVFPPVTTEFTPMIGEFTPVITEFAPMSGLMNPAKASIC
jgi:hypothetical protein